MDLIYLDNNATTVILPEVVDVMRQAWSHGPLNPSSQHAAGRRARSLLDQAAFQIGQCLGAQTHQPGGPQLLFTSGGTESNNLALHGLGPTQAHWLISRIEHPSILEVAKAQNQHGRNVHWLPVNRAGVVPIDAVEDTLREVPSGLAVVCVMAANNEIGTLQPIDQLATICHRYNAHLHVDATQWIGKLPLDFEQLGAGSVAFTAHKFHGPIGIGGLLLAPGVSLRAQWQGGAQQFGQRPGTEAVPLVLGMAEALRIATAGISQWNPVISKLRDQFENSLLARHRELVVHGAAAKRIPTTSCIGFPEVDRQSLLMSLDFAGVACSSGSACASGSSEPSYVLQALNLPEAIIDGSLRFGLSRFTTTQQITDAVQVVSQQYRRLRDVSARTEAV